MKGFTWTQAFDVYIQNSLNQGKKKHKQYVSY